MYRIHYSLIKSDGTAMPNMVTPWIASKDEANELWLSMKSEDCFTNLLPETKNGEIDEVEEYFTVTVKFSPNGKYYTYLSKTEVSVGTDVVVYTPEGREILKVISSGKKTKKELEKILPFSSFSYISGKVVPA